MDVILPCSLCGKNHAGACFAKNVECYRCHKFGHIGKMCRASSGESTRESSQLFAVRLPQEPLSGSA
ncbi:hypothetical protein TCAL_15057 [Tigriopus californicus]|uniref:CCHC-type domain-containing protein n=1 Tax=Tigriopus californicus TaxID=6832 RepID=A0A553NZ45_TIGCA|nr:hypothetical protein TCAL_15057 [Tigriopus californicus]